VVAVELVREPALSPLLAPPTGADLREARRDPVELAPRLHYLRIVPEVALGQYLESQLHLGPLASALTRHAGFRRLLEAAPGWQALIALGKLWHLTTRMDGPRWRWPLLVVDAPASGHGLSLLSAPDAVLDAVRSGPLHRQTQQVRELLRDPARSCVLPIALPEELPVREVLELRERVRELGIATAPVVANSVEPRPALEVERTSSALRQLQARGAAPRRGYL
jgi:anion-transporting  ArsA/GET3 family ATPase